MQLSNISRKLISASPAWLAESQLAAGSQLGEDKDDKMNRAWAAASMSRSGMSAWGIVAWWNVSIPAATQASAAGSSVAALAANQQRHGSYRGQQRPASDGGRRGEYRC